VAATTTLDLRGLRITGAALLAAVVVKTQIGGPGIPCPLRTATGVPCPLCGSTRSVQALADLDVARALFLNPAGVLAVVLAVAILLAWRVKQVMVPVWLVFAPFAALWGYQLFKYATGRPL
jgi:Protein of unknown function (DUF2752)